MDEIGKGDAVEYVGPKESVLGPVPPFGIISFVERVHIYQGVCLSCGCGKLAHGLHIQSYPRPNGWSPCVWRRISRRSNFEETLATLYNPAPEKVSETTGP